MLNLRRYISHIRQDRNEMSLMALTFQLMRLDQVEFKAAIKAKMEK